ncbi:hypothetical protein [Mycoplasmopsis primatum]|uniref:hypothetical protein n=1 Tax=Mycoplasmopsis primatum TaxID=55604 RepID=UPI000495333C|nr:hypothetical protein [Mycoplasmopsis primatum]
MHITQSETISFSFLTVFLLATFLIKIYFFFSLKEKSWYDAQKLTSSWFSNIIVLTISVILSICAFYPWLMVLLLRLFYRNYYRTDIDLIIVRIPIITGLIIAQFIILNSLILFLKFVILKKYAKAKN